MRRTVGIPQRERGVVDEVALMVLAVGTTVFAVGVAEARSRGHKMVHGGVEHAFVCLVGGLHRHSCELSVPGFVCCLHSGVEVPAGEFGLHVVLGLVDADGRECHFHEQRLAGILGNNHRTRGGVEAFNAHGLRELHVEVYVTVLCPTVGAAESCEACAVLLCEQTVVELVPAYALREVER